MDSFPVHLALVFVVTFLFTLQLEACKRQLQEARERERKTAEALMRADKWKKSLEEERGEAYTEG